MSTTGTATLAKIPAIFTEMIAAKGEEFSIFALVDMMRESWKTLNNVCQLNLFHMFNEKPSIIFLIPTKV